jgi:acetyl esterase/lipase
LRTVALLIGPGRELDRELLRRRAFAWGRDLGVEVDCRFADDEPALLALVAGRGADALVIDAGSADGANVRAVAGVRSHVVWLDDVLWERGELAPRWALAWAVQRLRHGVATYSYGPLPDQIGDLRTPHGTGPFPVAVLLHGGFWRERWLRDTTESLAIDLARRGIASWNLEYRRVGASGGGWPVTLQDVVAGIDALGGFETLQPLDLERVVFLGHSAGAQLALRAAVETRVRPRLVVSLAGITDVETAARLSIGSEGNATAAFMGGLPDELPGAYADASPLRRLPLGVPQLVVQGGRDDISELVEMSRRYANAVGPAGDEVELMELPEADHFDVIDPAFYAWELVAGRISSALAAG